ncbi:MAG TPA: hypothetical protein ENJ54_02025 [Chloroflexi bacterium]|nr:hypothetical protein [Chloroflexota bacterium]
MNSPTPMATPETTLPVVQEPQQGKMILLGALVGAMAGAALAYAYSRRGGARKVRLSASSAFKAGMLLLGTARQLVALLEEAEEEE